MLILDVWGPKSKNDSYFFEEETSYKRLDCTLGYVLSYSPSRFNLGWGFSWGLFSATWGAYPK